MDKKESNRRISAIVPVYNEAPRIGAILDVLTTHPALSEIIVVDDGSTDGTGEVISKYNVKYLRNERNRGKGHAMDRGVAASSGDIIFFCDADLKGLTHDMVDQIINPVLEGRLEMFIGMCNRDIYMSGLAGPLVKIGPLLGGQRALTKSLWEMLPAFYKHKFRIETGLNFFAEKYGKGRDYKIFDDLTQVIKEDKHGFLPGTVHRLFMIYDILIAELRLSLFDTPKIIKEKTKQRKLASMTRRV